MRVRLTNAFQLNSVMADIRFRSKAIIGVALLFLAASILSLNPFLMLTFMTTAILLFSVATGCVFWGAWCRFRQLQRVRHWKELATFDLSQMLLTDGKGELIWANALADEQLDAKPGLALGDILSGVLAGASPLVNALLTEANCAGAARREVQQVGGRVHVAVARVSDNRFAWRIQRCELETASDRLEMATITLGADDTVLFANPAARTLLGANADLVSLFCPSPPLRYGQINDVRTPDGLISCFVQQRTGSNGERDIVLLPASDPLEEYPDGWSYFEALPVPLLKLSRDGVIELSNRYARELLGVESGEGRKLSELMDGPGRPITDWLRDAAEGRGTVHAEILEIRRQDRETFVRVALNPTQDNGRTVLIAVMQDATKLKSLGAQFVQSQKMQAIGQLAGGVAHDFNNLLTAISGYCDLLLMRHDADDIDYPDLVQISQNTNRAAALVGQLLAYSRKQTLRPEIMDVRDMLSELMHLLNRLVGERVTLSLRNDPNLWAVRADKRQLEQVLMNLVVNARDAMPDGGEVRIRTENKLLEEPLKRDRAEVAPGRYVMITVQDQGVGIPNEQLEKVFEPFYTTKRPGEGTGLGLSTAYGIVKQTGGFIFVDSEAGKNTQFMMLLPAHTTADIKRAASAVREERPVAQPKGVVLLVEDEAPVRAFASRALKMRGLSVIEAACAEDALEILEDSELAIDVFVTDVVMPGMDGPTWVQKALKSRPKTRVIFVSGYAAETFGDVLGSIRNAIFLPKPFSLTELTETVREQLLQQCASETVLTTAPADKGYKHPLA